LLFKVPNKVQVKIPGKVPNKVPNKILKKIKVIYKIFSFNHIFPANICKINKKSPVQKQRQEIG